MIVFDTGHRLPKPLTVMAEGPSFRESGTPSPEQKVLSLFFRRLTRFASSNRGFAGQSRNDGLMSSL